MANLPRRSFLKTIGSAAVATALPHVILGAQSQKRSVAVLWEPGFRHVNGCDISRETLQQALGENFTVQFFGERDLIAQLDPTRFDLLVTPYGSAFPKRFWNTLLKYLRAGGNWLNIGGVPLENAVVRDGSSWSIEPAQTTYHKRLGITHSFLVDTSTYKVADSAFASGFKAEKVFELYVRLSSTNNEPDEAGSDGPHEGIVHPLVSIVNGNGRRVAAPVIQIDRLLGDFAGGCWVFANFSGSIEASLISTLAERAAQGASRFEVRTDFVSYKQGEIPVLTVEVLRPKGDLQKLAKSDFYVHVIDKTGAVVSRFNARLYVDGSKATVSGEIYDAAKFPPGFYKLEGRSDFNSLTHTSGFWIYDEALLARGKPLTVDKHFFYRDGRVFPVTGTTYMASDKHRRFLFEPNPGVWDNDFRAMKEAGVNLVRTGIWTGWKKYMPSPGKVDEAVLRAFDAFLLTAHNYDIPVIFTFFAFLPETWGGENAYLDPRAVKAQQQFVSAFSERCRHIDDVLWDFINEPSFCSP
ncbi:MAG TPA: hypothetical protein VGP98_06145, partial [Pyrinomonadaceae bacterium]|nr:hypothetical protein [Pyrinomonadaceae bacterium]